MTINDSNRRDRRGADWFSFDPLRDQRTGDEDRPSVDFFGLFGGLIDWLTGEGRAGEQANRDDTCNAWRE